MPFNIPAYRLISQKITGTNFTRSEEVVSWLGAVQAQDYAGSLWSIGLRLKNAVESDIERSIAGKKIVRTWPMRGTLHVVAADDVKWMLKLLTPRIIAGNTARLKRMGLDDHVFGRSKKIFIKALQGGKQYTRDMMYRLLESADIPAAGQRGIHILWRLAQEGLICFGPKEGKQYTFVLLDEWVTGGEKLNRREALAEIAKRYFISHGPATLQDFTWWTGLKKSDATDGLESVKEDLNKENFNGKNFWFSPTLISAKINADNIFLLPGFDEYMVAYKDRSDILDPLILKQSFYGLVTPKIIKDGIIAGSWKRTIKKDFVSIDIKLFSQRINNAKVKIKKAVKKYSEFMERKVMIN